MATLFRLYVGTGKQLPRNYRDDDGTPCKALIESSVLFSLDAQGISGATLMWTRGYWDGEGETSLVVEVLDNTHLGRDMDPMRTAGALLVSGAGASIKKKLNQDSVMMTATPTEVAFL